MIWNEFDFGGPDEFLASLCNTPKENRWEDAFYAFSKLIAHQKKLHAVVHGILHWYVKLNGPKRDPQITEIGVAFSAKRKRSEGFIKTRKLREAEFLSGKYDSLMTEKDRELKDYFLAEGLLRDRDWAYHPPIMPRHIARLATCENLLVLDQMWDSDDGYTDGFKSLKIDVTELKLRVFTQEDGGVSLLLPEEGNLYSESEYVLTYQGPHHYNLTYCTPLYLKMTALLREYGDEFELNIPPEGVSAFNDLLEKADGGLPISFDIASEARQGVKTALCEPIMRLHYEEGCLYIHGVIRLSRNPDLVVESAAGLVERSIITEKGEKLILQRDFEAEKKAIAPIQAVMAPFETARVDHNQWRFEDVREALDVLSSIKAAHTQENATFQLEWSGGEGLNLSEVVSHSASFSGGETADYWLSIAGSFELDDGKVLAFTDLIKNFDSREGSYVKLTDNRYLKLTAALARRVEALKGAGVARGGELLISPAALPSLEKATRDTQDDAIFPLPEIVRARIERIREVFSASVCVPSDFKCQMRPYQQEGYAWLSRLYACNIGACLADDMGLGKTIQVIALLLAKRHEGVSLVVSPASVVFNWRDELARFAPTLRVALIGEASFKEGEDVVALAQAADVIITSYGVLTSRQSQFDAVSWNIVALDEAQAIKNHFTKRAKSVRSLRAKFRLVATGTPIENRLSELWSLFDFINPGMLGGEAHFTKELTYQGEATPRLKRLVKPLILRRLKCDVLADLPEKEEITVPVLLSMDERHAYEAVRQNALNGLKGGDPSNKIAILAELTRLRRFCCHPALVMPAFAFSSKMEALMQLLDELHSNSHRALIFSQFVDYLAIVRRQLDERGFSYRYLDGATAKKDRERAVQSFQDGEGDFFLISLKAGGMGLNLTAANYVILLDPWWNPAVENQAADRAHRIGQRLPVTVYRLITKDTIEEKVVNLHAKKTALAEDILASGAAALSAEAMLDLLS